MKPFVEARATAGRVPTPPEHPRVKNGPTAIAGRWRFI